MITMDWSAFISGNHRAPDMPRRRYALTVGVFDGLHIGHAALVNAVVARTPALASAVLTFTESPKKILRPATFRGDLISLPEKVGLLESMGVDFCVLIDFSTDFGTLSGVDFLTALRDAEVEYLAVGPDFRCGHRQDTDVQALTRICAGLGIQADTVAPVLYAGHPVSSSRIRHAVTEGRLRDAERMLGRPYGAGLKYAETAYRLPQGRVAPPAGAYEAEIETGSGRMKTTAEILPDGTVRCAGCGSDARSIVFLDTVSRR